MRPGKPVLSTLWQALDEASFGRDRILNLRESLPTAADARARADAWLRMRQVSGGGEVLMITGRGNQSANGIGVIRQEILALLPSLRRLGVVVSWREHTPGSFVVSLAPLKALLNAAQRRRSEPAASGRAKIPQSLAALEPETLQLLRMLAVQNLDLLGVSDAHAFVEGEMERTFSVLAASVPPGANREQLLRDAIQRGLEEAS